MRRLLAALAVLAGAAVIVAIPPGGTAAPPPKAPACPLFPPRSPSTSGSTGCRWRADSDRIVASIGAR